MNDIIAAFALEGTAVSCVPYGQGHVNHTYLVETDRGRRYILQRISGEAFHDIPGLMENVSRVTAYLARRVSDPRECLRLVPARAGGDAVRDGEGDYWRVFDFVEHTVCLDRPERPEDFYQAAVAFGRFQALLRDYPAATLHETIPNFHNTPDRCRLFHAALASDALGRAAGAEPEIAFALAHESGCGALQALRKSGELPLRVTHNDTKLNNVLLDSKTRKGVCVIDLDTVMPGLAAWDFGDSIRYGANDCPEDEPDLGKVHLNMAKYETYLRGYLDAAGAALTPLEKETLPWGARVITLETGIRFLTDYLEGDHYFRISRPSQNLDRTRKMLKLTEEMEAHFSEMGEAVRRYGG